MNDGIRIPSQTGKGDKHERGDRKCLETKGKNEKRQESKEANVLTDPRRLSASASRAQQQQHAPFPSLLLPVLQGERQRHVHECEDGAGGTRRSSPGERQGKGAGKWANIPHDTVRTVSARHTAHSQCTVSE